MSEYFCFPELKDLNDKIGILLRKNSYGVIGDLREIMRPKQVAPGNWYRISCTGELGLCDYNAGIVCLRFFSLPNHLEKEIKWSPRLYISTLDDGDWEADGKKI